jgi:hypothetical protein
MSGVSMNRPSKWLGAWTPLLALWLGVVAGAPALAQEGKPAWVPANQLTLEEKAPASAASPIVDPEVKQANCPSCSGGLLAPELGGCATGTCAAGCYPGRKPCDCAWDADTCVGRFFGGLYNCICCPDPCYEPHWNPLADAALFTDGARPVTQTRFRFDGGWNMPFPDKAEYFWARADGKGKGPTPPKGVKGEIKLNYQDFSVYTEGAIDRIGVFVELPYRHISPETYPGASGMADMNVGTKTLLLDCELTQVSFQFRTYAPTGNFTKGLGTGHVALEPSLLFAFKLTDRLYAQSELAYLFPLGGDQTYQGPIFHYHGSLNYLLCNCGHDIQLIGTAEMVGYEIEGGAYTDPFTGTPLSAKDIGSIFSMGPGLRLEFCDKIDFGVGGLFSLTNDRMTKDLIRAEFRWRF